MCFGLKKRTNEFHIPMTKRRYFTSLLACLAALGMQAQKTPQWIAMEPVDTIINPGVHFGAGLTRKVGMYKMPEFRRQFDVTKKLRHANARVCGLGHFEMSLNGKKVGDHFLDPGWTCYDKEALYVDFDVTKMLSRGQNEITVLLGNGFFNIPNERYFKLICSYGQPRLWMELTLEYADGSQETVVTDCDSWQVCPSPITYSSIYGGESYDARLEEQKQWQKPISAPADIQLIPQKGTEITVHSTVPEKRHHLDPEGRWVYDLGQNCSGIVRLTVRGARGSEVQMWPAELIDDKGYVMQNHSGSPYHWDYTLRGDGKDETWQPRFSFYGQRYVMVVGAVPEGEDNPNGLPVISKLTGLHTTVNTPEVGQFSCGDTLFNRIHTLIDWAIRSNSQSVITDCPHREKLGWIEQDYLMQQSILYRYDMSPVYRKIIRDIEASQWENGCIPTIAPMYVMFAGGFEDTPEWGSAFIICPWYLYKWYGDRSIIEQHYPAMQRFINYLSSRADNHIIAYGLGDWVDIGPGPLGVSQLTSNGVTATAIYYYDVKLMAEMARLLNKNADAEQYERLAADIRKAFNEKYYNAEGGYYDRNSQTANAMPLYVGLVEEQNRSRVLQSLIKDIESRGYALTAGDIGYRFVVQALQKAGRSDVIYRMNSNEDVPGYAWQLKQGATALPESWQAFNYVSNNHLMLGHLMEWLYAGLCGIRQTEESVGWQHLLIAPCIVPEMGNASASVVTPKGKVSVQWTLKNGKLTVKGKLPADCDARIEVPESGISQSLEGGSFKVTGQLSRSLY